VSEKWPGYSGLVEKVIYNSTWKEDRGIWKRGTKEMELKSYNRKMRMENGQEG
jgi:hypothetical protein